MSLGWGRQHCPKSREVPASWWHLESLCTYLPRQLPGACQLAPERPLWVC